jgi:beta-fructofuranosidase
MNPIRKIAALTFCTASLLAAENGRLTAHDAESLARAQASVAKAVERVRGDTNRPGYHILPPANWMNDPNGPIYHNGYWHLFYQHNPYGDGWGNMHWGHVRSRNLMHWEHLPIALWPSKEVGEDHVFSGCAAIRADGKPVLFYTSIGREKSTDYAEQWMAIGDPNLLKWEKPGSNPALAESLHGETKVWDWRDPFLFKYKGADYMVLGGHLRKDAAKEGSVFLYKAKDESLASWEYLGVLFTQAGAENVECPNFFELNGKWMLITSPHRRVEYFIGDFDGKRFTPRSNGLMDHSDNFYAPNCATDDNGRRVLWGWIRGFKDGQGWNGCLTLPRILTIDERGKLWQAPADTSELRQRELFSRKEHHFKDDEPLAVPTDSSRLEISAAFHSGNQSGIKLPNGLEMFFENGKLKVGDQTVEHMLSAIEPFAVTIYLDHSVVEVYANGRTCLSKVHYSDSWTGKVEFFTKAGNAILSAAIHELGSGWVK